MNKINVVQVKNFLIIYIFVVFQSLCFAQIEPPDDEYLFQEDKVRDDEMAEKRKKVKARKSSVAGKRKQGQDLPFDIDAESLTFDSSTNKLKADGDVLITYSSLSAEAEHVEVDVSSNTALLKGNVRIDDISSSTTADSATINLKEGSGEIENTEIYFNEGDYHLTAKKASREVGNKYVLSEARLTTCNCPEEDGSYPWEIDASSASITPDGYGQAWNAVIRVHDFPVFYFPYLIFPAKTERQSGFLPAKIGGFRNDKTGFELELPFFWAIDKSTDATLTGILQTKVRRGIDTEFRRIFSLDQNLQFGLLYLDESAREGKLLGSKVDGLYEFRDGTTDALDEQRLSGYLNYVYNTSVGETPVQAIVDGRYVSDDLLVREYEKEEIAEDSARFVTSQAVLRVPFADAYSLDLSTEYNQSIISDDDLVFQRLPEVTLSGLNSLRPFGENKLGLKLVFNTKLNAVNFVRQVGYQGQRIEAKESVKLPFFFKNYFDGFAETSLRATQYEVDSNEEIPYTTTESNGAASFEEDDDEEDILPSSNRFIPGVTGGLNSVLEKVFTVDEGNLIKFLGELGSRGRTGNLVRLKHTIEPGLRYRFVPNVNQDDNPQFDSSDRLAERNVVTYQLVQRLFARYEPRDTYLYGIEEVTPEIKDLGTLNSQVPIDQASSFGFESDVAGDQFQRLRRGSVKELANFKLSQSYDLVEANEDKDPNRPATSDLSAAITLYPNDYIKLRGKTDFDVEKQDFSSYAIDGQLTSKRGDSVRSRLRFVEERVRQLESSIEVKVTEKVRLGYYSRYDDLESEFIEQKGGIRFVGGCNCWLFDVTASDRINPDETKFDFNITLLGLGDISSPFLTLLKDKNAESASR